MKNVLSEHKKIKLWKKKHFVENKIEIMQCILCLLDRASLW